MIFECNNLILGYENRIVAQNVNFAINEGDYLCIVGENGAGKSTLIKTLLGFIKPIGGQISVNFGKSLKGIGYLPQQTEAQKDFPASVWEVVLSGQLNSVHRSPFYSKADKSNARNNLKKLGIDDLKRCCYRELSGGQKQKVLLARALCATDNVLILDEPVTGLDPGSALDFYEQIKKLNQEGVTIIMVTHDIRNGLKYASHILHLEQGNDFFGTTQEYRQSNISTGFLGGAGND
jgi:zinc transport system ATP-binding protein